MLTGVSQAAAAGRAPVAELTPTIVTSGSPAALTTTYGTSSASTSFSVSGSNMLQGILVTPPAGFEVSTNNVTFSSTVTVGGAGNIAATMVYIRLMATAAVNGYSGNIVLTSTGAANADVVMPASTVNQAQLTISPGNVTKTYGQALTTVTGSTAFTDMGLQNGETIGSVTIVYSAGSAATDGVGTYNGVVSAQSPTGGTFDPANYSIHYTYGQIIVNPATLTVTAEDVTKVYGQTLTGGPGSTAFTSTGLQNGETIGTVTINYGTGAETNYPAEPCDECVTAAAPTGGTFSPNNYTIKYVPGNIIVTQAPLVITANTINKPYGTTLTSGPGSTAFTPTGLQNGETVGSVTITYGAGGQANYPIGTCDNCAVATDPAGGTFNPNDYSITYDAGDINVVKAALTITANDISKTYGQTLTGGAGSTAFIAMGLQNGETVGSVTISYGAAGQANAPAGACEGCVVATAPAGGTFNPDDYTIKYVPGNINIATAVLTITANDTSKTYGQTLTGGAGSTAFMAIGLKNEETIGSVTISYGPGGQANYQAGVCEGCVVPTLPTGGTFNPDDYTIGYANGNINIATAALTITANSVTKTYGETLTGGAGSTAFTSIGLVNGETIGSVTISYGAGGEPNYPAGTCDLCVTATSPTGGTFNADDYAIDYLAGNITITPAPLTITADNQLKLYGEPNPALTVTYAGFLNGDGPAQLTTPPTVITTATLVSPPGEYPITPEDASDPNYDITYQPGTLTITASFNIPNAFTPNGDGVNDTWHIQFLDNYQNCTVNIFTRYGQSVYYSNGYGVPWDGTFKGSVLPTGTYYYIIKLNDINKVLSGYVALIR